MRGIVWVLCGFLLSCSPGASGKNPPTENAVEYRLLAVEDTGFAGRTRKSARIYAPEATTVVARAETALKAAVNLQQRWDADAVGVFLEISPLLQGQGYVYAIANYSPDGGGWSGNAPFRNRTWEAEASGIVLSADDIKIGEMWYARRAQFQVDDGFGGTQTDEKAVAASIANEMVVSVESVSLLPLVEIISSRKHYAGPK
ncbi:MAG: DUF4875 domain-containing protein [Amphiplicatus sp.]